MASPDGDRKNSDPEISAFVELFNVTRVTAAVGDHGKDSPVLNRINVDRGLEQDEEFPSGGREPPDAGLGNTTHQRSGEGIPHSDVAHALVVIPDQIVGHKSIVGISAGILYAPHHGSIRSIVGGYTSSRGLTHRGDPGSG